MTRRLALGALVLIALLPPPARAHPFGQQPVALITEVRDGLRIEWVANDSEYRDLAGFLRLGPVTPVGMGSRPEFIRYMVSHLSVRAAGEGCEERFEGVRTVPDGASTSIRFDCPPDAIAATVRLTLLQDVNTKYVTLFRALIEGSERTGAFAVGATTVRLDLTGAAAPSPVAEPSPTANAGARARILAMIQGQAGSVSLGIALGFAFLLGALHALTPGHGKTITAAYLVGAGGTMRQAIALGGVVSATHAVSVAALGGIAIGLGQRQPSDRISIWLEVAAGALILALGIALLRPRRARAHVHADARAEPLPLRRLAAVGVVGGLVPNPDAILIAFLAFQAHRWTVGVGLIAAFSLGLALVVLAIAAAAVRGARLVRSLASGRVAALAPRIAAAMFLAMGIAVTVRAAVRL